MQYPRRCMTAAFIIAICVFGSVPAAAWQVETVDSYHDFADGDLVVGDDGVPHLAYGQLALYYSYYDTSSTSWKTSVVDSTYGVGRYASIALNSAGYPVISYYDFTNNALKLAYMTEGLGGKKYWVKETIDDGGGAAIVGQYTSLFIDGEDHMFVSYYDQTNTALKFATNRSGAWTVTTVDDSGSVGRYSSIVVDGSNNVHISYYEYIGTLSGFLKYARLTWRAASWDIARLDGSDVEPFSYVGTYTSICVDSGENPHISYYDSTNSALKHAYYSSGWNFETADSGGTRGKYTSIAMNTSNQPVITYYDDDNDRIMKAERTGANAFSVDVVASISTAGLQGTDYFTSVAVNGDDRWVAYRNSYNIDLSARNLAADPIPSMRSGVPSWATTTIDTTGAVGEQASMAADSDGRPHIVYSDDRLKVLRYAYYDGADWQIETLAADTGQLGTRYNSIAVDSANHPHVAYINDDNYIRYAYHNGASWQIETADDAADIDNYISLAVDSAGWPHIAFFNTEDDELAYLHKDGTGWHRESVVGGDSYPGRYCSIAVDSSGYPHISHYSDDEADLFYSHKDGGGWHTETVDSDDDVGKYTAIALDSSERPHITYWDDSNTLFKYARWTGSSWAISSFPPATSNWVDDGYAPVALDQHGRPHSMYNYSGPGITGEVLDYAYMQGGVWKIEPSIYESQGLDEEGANQGLVIDMSGNIHIAMYDYGLRDLIYITGPAQSGSFNAGVLSILLDE